MIIAVTGKIGSGKTTLAKIISKDLSLEYIDLNDLITRNRPYIDIRDPKCICNEEEKKAIMDIMMDGREKASSYIHKHIVERFLEDTLYEMHYDAVIEGTILPILYVWEKSDFRIILDAFYTDRIDALNNRYIEQNEPIMPETDIKIWDDIFNKAINTGGIKDSNYCFNDYTKESLMKFLESADKWHLPKQ